MSGSARSRMPLRLLLSSIAGWRTTTPCIPIPGWAIAHPGSTSVPNPLRVRFDGVNSRLTFLRGRLSFLLHAKGDQRYPARAVGSTRGTGASFPGGPDVSSVEALHLEGAEGGLRHPLLPHAHPAPGTQ